MSLPKNKLYPLRWFSFALVLALGACGDDSGDDDDGNDERDSGSNTPDAGRDSGTSMDASTDSAASRDAAADAAPDSSTTPPGTDASVDAATADTGVPDAGGNTPQTLNGCAPANYMDVSGTGAAVIMFGGQALGQTYSPKCATVNVGQVVRFVGNFASHNLEKGIPGNTSAGSPSSPITLTQTGQMEEFTFTAPGTYPYVCLQHDQQGMVGAIHVK
jgi:plastocyanin